MAVAMVIAAVIAGTTPDRGRAAFTGSTVNGANLMTAAASFPTYQAKVAADVPTFYHQGEEAVQSTATVTAATAVGVRTGVYDAPTNGPSLWYKLDESSGTTTAKDSSGAGAEGTLGAGATFTSAGNTGSAASFSAANVNTNAVSSGQTPVDTTKSFTVTAWVNPTNITGGRVALSQNGTAAGGFALKASTTGSTRWEFLMSQSNQTTFDSAVSTTAVATGAWTFLAATFTVGGGASALKLYVNNSAAFNGTHTSTWSAANSFDLGRIRTSSTAWGSPWLGAIDDVRAFRRALSAAEITALYNGTANGPDGSWDFEDASTGVTTTADGSGNGNPAVPASTSTVNWAAGHTGSTKAAVLDGSSTSYLTASRAPIRTDQDFTVSVWAKLTTVSVEGAVLSLAGNGFSAMYVYNNMYNNTWGLCMTPLDAATPGSDCAYTGPGSCVSSCLAINTWYHIVGTWDVSSGVGTIRVNNGTPVNSVATSAFSATSTLQIGRYMKNAGWLRYFPGSIDDVTVYQRVLSSAEITALYGAGSGGSVGAGPGLGMAAGQPGALQGAQQGLTGTTAVAYSGVANGYNNTSDASPGPANFSLECWFRVSGGWGGHLIGFSSTKNSPTGTFDRQLYLTSTGVVRFGATAAQSTISSPAGYNDGDWHHVVATLSATAGIALYLDGALVNSNAAVKTAGSYAGYWRWGGANLAGWPDRPPTDHLVGSIDEVAVFNTKVLNAQDVAWHYYANH